MVTSDRQRYIRALRRHAITPILTEGIEVLMEDSDTSFSSSSTSSDSSDSSDEELEILARLYAAIQNRYLHPRRPIPRRDSLIEHILTTFKDDFPKEFRRYARMWPDTFDKLVEQLETADVFQNNSSSQHQMPVDRQLMITLIRFGMYGNGASIDKIADIAGVGHGTVDLATRRVITAIKENDIKGQHIKWPNNAERERAKVLIE
jgi:hypothetical protein